MIWQVIIEKPAQLDIDEAFVWYEEQSNGLGVRFVDALHNVIETIIRNPYFASVLLQDVRSDLLSVFPYARFYIWQTNQNNVFLYWLSGICIESRVGSGNVYNNNQFPFRSFYYAFIILLFCSAFISK